MLRPGCVGAGTRRAGFEALWISDHFHPWNHEQGQAPFVWSVIGGLSQVTGLPVTTAVTCPTGRIHPAVIAQAAATAAVLLEGRFVLGLGTGEALNESVLGGPWPTAAVRLEMLEEAVEVIRALHSGEVVDTGAGTTPSSTPRCSPGRSSRHRSTCPRSAPSRCRTAEEGAATAYRLWANQGLPGELAQVLPTVEHFEQASQLVTEEMIGESTPCGPDPEIHVSAIQEFIDAGYDRVYINQIGSQQEEFFRFWREELAPRLR